MRRAVSVNRNPKRECHEIDGRMEQAQAVL
jgi:hypothetical protein